MKDKRQKRRLQTVTEMIKTGIHFDECPFFSLFYAVPIT